jgi:hypothetical protein
MPYVETSFFEKSENAIKLDLGKRGFGVIGILVHRKDGQFLTSAELLPY